MRSERVHRIVPALKKLSNTVSDRTGVTFYEGKKGVLTVLNDIIETGQELWFYGSRKMALEVFAHYPDNFIHKRVEHGIKLRAVLSLEDKNHPAYNEKDVQKLSDVKYVASLNGIPSNVFIYGNTVAFITSTQNAAGIMIKNVDVVKQQKQIFEILWISS